MVSLVIRRAVIILVSVTNVMAAGVIEQVNISDSNAVEPLASFNAMQKETLAGGHLSFVSS